MKLKLLTFLAGAAGLSLLALSNPATAASPMTVGYDGLNKVQLSVEKVGFFDQNARRYSKPRNFSGRNNGNRGYRGSGYGGRNSEYRGRNSGYREYGGRNYGYGGYRSFNRFGHPEAYIDSGP